MYDTRDDITDHCRSDLQRGEQMKTCKKCGKPIPESMRLIAIFCSENCRKLHSKHAKRDRLNEVAHALGYDTWASFERDALSMTEHQISTLKTRIEMSA